MVYVAAVSPSGLRCLYLNHDDSTEPLLPNEQDSGPEACVSQCELSAHGRSLLDSHLIAEECAPRELRTAAAAWRSARDRTLLELELRRDLELGGPLCSPPLPHGLARYPLRSGQPPRGMTLLLLPRVRPSRDFMEVIHLQEGFNPGPRMCMSELVLTSLRRWRLAGLRGGCTTFASMQQRVRNYMRQMGMSVTTL